MDTGPRLRANWEDWFIAIGPALVLFARGWVSSHADAEDVVQEAFVRFWNTGRQRAEDPRAYLFACVKRAALDLRRRRVRRQRRETNSRAGQSSSRVSDTLFDSELERDEWRASVEAALTRLPGLQREVLVMKVWGELTNAQIATVLGVSPNTVASRYRYALDSLRRHIADENMP
jgi:RNA polymerase sigma-70 factor (ECF subfamily)